MRTTLFIFAIPLFFVACGSSRSSQFPSREDLLILAERPAPQVARDRKIVDVAEWDLTGPLPTQIGDTPTALSGPVGQVLKDVMASTTMLNSPVAVAAAGPIRVLTPRSDTLGIFPRRSSRLGLLATRLLGPPSTQ